MKQKASVRKYRRSLFLLYTGIALIILLLTAVIVGVTIFFLVRGGVLNYGKADLDARYLLLSIVVGSFVIGSILSVFISRIALRPVNRILNGINRLALGDYSARLSFGKPIGSHPTFRELTESFNKMAEELDNTQMLRSDFVNSFSHEFKTPIVSIAGFAKILRRGNLSDEKKEEYLIAIEEESMRLSQMATNMLNLTRVENQGILTEVKRVDVTEEMRTALLVLEQKWEKKNIEPVIPAEEYYCDANEELIKQVFLNLFDNAIKFSPENAQVEARIANEKSMLRIEILNSGDPIPEENRDKVFNKFYRGDDSHSTEGNGVGLAVVKKIVELHGGTITAGEEDGRTVFTMLIPVNARK